MTQAEIDRRKPFLKGGYNAIAKAINKAYADAKIPDRITSSLVGKVIAGDRPDHHGIIGVFRALTDKEQKRRTQLALKLSK